MPAFCSSSSRSPVSSCCKSPTLFASAWRSASSYLLRSSRARKLVIDSSSPPAASASSFRRAEAGRGDAAAAATPPPSPLAAPALPPAAASASFASFAFSLITSSSLSDSASIAPQCTPGCKLSSSFGCAPLPPPCDVPSAHIWTPRYLVSFSATARALRCCAHAASFCCSKNSSSCRATAATTTSGTRSKTPRSSATGLPAASSMSRPRSSSFGGLQAKRSSIVPLAPSLPVPSATGGPISTGTTLHRPRSASSTASDHSSSTLSHGLPSDKAVMRLSASHETSGVTTRLQRIAAMKARSNLSPSRSRRLSWKTCSFAPSSRLAESVSKRRSVIGESFSPHRYDRKAW
mmetsp:Transcript_27625/g.70603  ORF Transcript_27625/g.70603 Transcript_27625/m.70603 type:complete len:349 (+) Transcript_27625:323-1369(+)